MLGFFINDHAVPYTLLILQLIKTIETRTRNTLKALIGQRVAIIQTGKGPAQIVGYVTITKAVFCPADQLDSFREQTRVPKGSSFDKCGTCEGVPGKWFYYLDNPEPCTPYPVPADAVRHGRVWVEF